MKNYFLRRAAPQSAKAPKIESAIVEGSGTAPICAARLAVANGMLRVAQSPVSAWTQTSSKLDPMEGGLRRIKPTSWVPATSNSMVKVKCVTTDGNAYALDFNGVEVGFQRNVIGLKKNFSWFQIWTRI